MGPKSNQKSNTVTRTKWGVYRWFCRGRPSVGEKEKGNVMGREKKEKEKLVPCTCCTKEILIYILRSKFYGINFQYDLPLIKIISNQQCNNHIWKFNKQSLVISRLMKFTNRHVFYEWKYKMAKLPLSSFSSITSKISFPYSKLIF